MLFIFYGPRFSGKKTCAAHVNKKCNIKKLRHITTAEGYDEDGLKSLGKHDFASRAVYDTVVVHDGHNYAVDREELEMVRANKIDRLYVIQDEVHLRLMKKYLPKTSYKLIYFFSDKDDLEIRMHRVLKDKNAISSIILNDFVSGLHDDIKKSDYCVVNKNDHILDTLNVVSKVIHYNRDEKNNFLRKIFKSERWWSQYTLY